MDPLAVLGSMFNSLWVSQPQGDTLGSRLIQHYCSASKKQFDFVAVLGSMFSSLWVSQPHGEILGSRLITLHLYPEKSF